MKKNNLKLFLLLGFTLVSCISNTSFTNSTSSEKKITSSTFDLISLGDNSESVIQNLGKPTKIISNSWIYLNNDQPQQQKASISFDTKTQLVISKSYIPFENEPEESLDFLMQKKFVNIKFEKVPLLKCMRDFTPSTIFYINISNGIVIEAHKNDNTVSSINLVTTALATDQLNKIKSCAK